ncbi:hypothetical protein [Pseudobacteriovorax antillogorgiicola]|uniref:Uncharacterized protein n=1 Tax=Pseudobacteriovorax antillogorgiicola TaxID=1513793 RepID=A0A1Y6BA44_9BACT|nr:hypothetical protein [Pseudobacteriovorax antillogorgiicola]TCS59294.1 hypothetical protein EDD56_101201 [Pseudobacteriovorax antillogorgiicola]SME89663.1 hypothetical protein SAMN06296036_101285 [Pseudobacteriovorax antillogorgiicola]
MIKTIAVFVALVCPMVGLSQVQRVGGNFEVVRIKPKPQGLVEVVFHALTPSGKYDQLQLISDHVHMGVKVGDHLRLSAEIVEPKPHGLSQVSQVLIFLPSRQGETPVWMLSRTRPPQKLSGAKLLEMHAPGADYQIF